MRCIFCLEERPGSLEHVFPSAIGGSLTTDRVCSACNSSLGHRVDAALSNNFIIEARRAKFGLAGNSGRVPQLYDLLLGKSDLVNHPGEVRVDFDEKAGTLDIRMIPHISDATAPGGPITRQIIVDERDRDQLPKIIQRERKRLGMPPLSDEELAQQLHSAPLTSQAIVNPAVTKKLSISSAFLRHAMIKIAYELAFLWLGEGYLDDPLAQQIRIALCADDPASTNDLPADVKQLEDNELFKFWVPNDAVHLAYASVFEKSIAILLKVFDAFQAVVYVTDHSARYLSGPDAEEKLRFLAIDSKTGRMQDTSFRQEQHRVVASMLAASREASPSD